MKRRYGRLWCGMLVMPFSRGASLCHAKERDAALPAGQLDGYFVAIS
jgi:hypothetical protein